MGNYDGSIKIDTSISTAGISKGIQGITNSLKGVAAAVGIAFGITTVVNFTKSAVNAASDMANALTGLKSILNAQGRSFTEAKKFIDSYTADGLIPATNAIAAYKNLATRGFSTKEIEKLMLIMKDSAAFNRQSGLSMGEAVERASSGLRQENSLLTDSVGIQKNVARMWDEYAKKIGTTVQALTLEQKRQAELNGFVEESKYFMGDAAKAAQTYSGKLSALLASFLNLRVAIGDAIIPVLVKIIPYVKMVTDRLTVMFNTIAQIVQAFLGYDPSANTAAAEAAAQAAQKGADAQAELAQNTEDAKKAAKGSLAAFDELNVLQEKQAAPEEPQTNNGNKDQADESGISPKLQAWADGIKAKLQEIFGPLITWGKTELLPAFFDLLAAGSDVLTAALIALQPLGIWLWENFLKPAGEWVGQALLDGLKWLTDRLNELAKWVKENPEDFRTMVVIIGEFFAAWKVADLGVAVAALIGHLMGATGALIGNTAAWVANTAAKIADKAETIAIIALYVGDFLKSLATSAAKLGAETAAWIASTAAKIAANVAQIALNVAVGIWNGIAVIATAVTTAFGAAVAFLTSPIGLVIIAIIAIIAVIVLLITHWDWVKQKASEVWSWIVDQWGKAGAWFNTNVGEPIKNAFQSALNWVDEKWRSIFGGIVGFVKNSVNTIIDFINGMIRAIADGINTVINGLNSLRIDIPDWVPNFGGSSWGLALPLVNAPQIPRLATGGVIPANAARLAVVGDNRTQREIVSPEDLMRQIVREEIKNIGGQEITIRFEGTLAQFVRELRPVIERENNRIGGNLITGGALA